MLIVLVGLIGVVTVHERSCLEDTAHDTLVTVIERQAGMIELYLLEDAQTLSPSDLQMGQFDADEMLRFEARLLYHTPAL